MENLAIWPGLSEADLALVSAKLDTIRRGWVLLRRGVEPGTERSRFPLTSGREWGEYYRVVHV